MEWGCVQLPWLGAAHSCLVARHCWFPMCHAETEASSLTPDVRIFPLDKVSREGRRDPDML